MCGIAGIAAVAGSPGPEPAALARMLATLIHRGPDAEGAGIEGGVALGARRLAVIDVAGGRQPLSNEDGSVRAVFNGEIYNFRELRRELERKGHRLRSGSDGEVLTHLWEEHGVGFASRLEGMFAVALHDARRRRLCLARDRVGIKPLYHARAGRDLVFGSEVKALLASGRVERRLDLDALQDFLAWEYVPAPATLLADVRKLEPGRLLELDLATGEVGESSYWELPVPGPEAPRRFDSRSDSRSDSPSDSDWEEQVDAAIGRAVGRQLVSDVPLGALLSGGVDSSLVVAHAGDVRTFGIGFEAPGYDESRWAARVADHLGVSHRSETVRGDVAELFDPLMEMMDDPIADSSIFPTYRLAQLARSEVTVALSGDGGDELFGGYPTYAAQERWRTWRRLPALLRREWIEPWLRRLPPRASKRGLLNDARRFAEGCAHDPALGHARWRFFLGESLREQLFTPEARAGLSRTPERHVLDLFESERARPELDRALAADLRSYLVDDCLVKLDRATMACSLEARVPFLDTELVELAFRVPPELKVRGGETKRLLKRVAARHVPADCVTRPKQGFSAPVRQWLRGPLRPRLEDLLGPERVARDGILRGDTVGRLVREHLANRADHGHLLWALVVFHDWRRRWKV